MTKLGLERKWRLRRPALGHPTGCLWVPSLRCPMEAHTIPRDMTASRLTLLALALLVLPRNAAAWHQDGHKRITALAVAAVRDRMPDFFGDGEGQIVHNCADPDLFTHYWGSELRDQERPEHYIDLERLGGAELPRLRSEFDALCRDKGVAPSAVGAAPYAITEWTQRLRIAFAEHRKWPGNPHIRAKTCVYAGILAHYAADLCMPLHVTEHYDGRLKADGESPETGIHAKVDALAGKLRIERAELLSGLSAAPVDDIMQAVLAQVGDSRSLVERVYELEDRLPKPEEPLGDDPDVVAFTRGRLRRATSFLGSLYLTAWTQSAETKLPDWHRP